MIDKNTIVKTINYKAPAKDVLKEGLYLWGYDYNLNPAKSKIVSFEEVDFDNYRIQLFNRVNLSCDKEQQFLTTQGWKSRSEASKSFSVSYKNSLLVYFLSDHRLIHPMIRANARREYDSKLYKIILEDDIAYLANNILVRSDGQAKREK